MDISSNIEKIKKIYFELENKLKDTSKLFQLFEPLFQKNRLEHWNAQRTLDGTRYADYKSTSYEKYKKKIGKPFLFLGGALTEAMAGGQGWVSEFQGRQAMFGIDVEYARVQNYGSEGGIRGRYYFTTKDDNLNARDYSNLNIIATHYFEEEK